MDDLISLYIFKKKQNSFLVLLSICAISLLLVRVKITHSFYLLFLIWNLILAFIPYFISNYIKADLSLKKSNFKNLICITIWLLFVPNTFYLITDFVHLHHESHLQYIFDFWLLVSFSAAGFYLGILSIQTIYNQIQFFYSNKISNLFIISISFLCSFGIYVGRILRFNSWDIISNPIRLTTSIYECLFQIETWKFSIILGLIILLTNIIYSKIKSIK